MFRERHVCLTEGLKSHLAVLTPHECGC